MILKHTCLLDGRYVVFPCISLFSSTISDLCLAPRRLPPLSLYASVSSGEHAHDIINVNTKNSYFQPDAFSFEAVQTNIQSCIKNNEELKLFSFYVPEDSQKVREIYSLDKLQLRLKIEKFHFERTRVSSIFTTRREKTITNISLTNPCTAWTSVERYSRHMQFE